MYYSEKQKGIKKSIISLAIIFMMLVSMAVVPVEAAAVQAIDFKNVTGEGKNAISLSDKRNFEAVLVTDGSISPDEVVWAMERKAGAQDEKIFPHQYLGGKLEDWKVWNTQKPYFTNVSTEKYSVDGKDALKLSFSTEYFLDVNRVDSPRGNRNVILDHTGDFTLTCSDLSGKILGQATVKVNPYDDYRTHKELEEDLLDAKAKADTINGLYIDVLSVGKSTQGYDMPYAVISDSKASVENYHKQNKLAQEDPDTFIKKINSGADYKIPVLYSNIHADENPGVDAPMNFIWDIVNSFENGGKITYNILTGFTPEGEKQLKLEMEQQGIHWSELIKDHVTGLGFIKAGNKTSGPVDLEKYYTVESYTLDVNELLDNIIFIVVPSENADGRTNNVRQNGNGFDLNRDNMFQTQTETQNMTRLIAQWNPATMIELHGFVSSYQVEPCSPPHEPNFEYDLFAENGIKSGEAFGIGAIANNSDFNSYVMPLRDYLVSDEKGNPYWQEPWDDMSTNYTPQYSMLHGTVAFTIEVPAANQEATKSLEYGLIHHGAYVMENKDAFYKNQLTGWARGIKNIDEPAIRDWYVDVNDNIGAEADIFRPKYEGNNNFFPECYIIPLDGKNQSNIEAAYAMQKFLLDNGVKVHSLNTDVTFDKTTYPKGSMVVTMYQAKRNVANGALYDGILITAWPDLYSEPITAFGEMRGFDYAAVDTKGLVKDNMLTEIKAPQTAKTYFTGETGGEVIIDNNSVSAIAMVNKMLSDGIKVGFITEGTYKGDFVVSYGSFVKYQDKFIVKGTGVKSIPDAQTIKKPSLYIPGFAGDYSVDSEGNEYGVFNYPNYGNTNYNFDMFAYVKQMGFSIVKDVKDADIIAGNRALNDDAIKAVKEGKAYLGAGAGALEKIKTDILGQYGFDYVSNGTNQDALYFVTFDSDSLITASNIKNNDNLIYSYGGAYISSVPTNAEILMTTTKETPLEGFMMEENLEKFLGAVQAFSYNENGMDVTVFAGSLTNKAHQQDEYQLAANTIFSKSLGTDYNLSFTDIAGHWGYDAIMYSVGNGLYSGTSQSTFSPDLGMNRAMMATVLYNMSKDAADGKSSFTDVAEDAWYAKGVSWAEKNGIITGMGDGTFAPLAPVTREQAALMLYNYAKLREDKPESAGDYSVFSDSASVSSWASEAMKYAVGNKLFSGIGDNTLSPKGEATRAQMAAILQRFLEN